MAKQNTRRVILRTARFATASGGICLLMSFPAQQANAATDGQPPVLGAVTDVLGSVVSTVTGSVTGTAQAVGSASAPANQVTPSASGGPPSQPTRPQDRPQDRPPATQTNRPAADILSPLTGIMPRWLIDVLLAVGLTAGASYVAEPVAVLARRRRQGAGQSGKRRK